MPESYLDNEPIYDKYDNLYEKSLHKDNFFNLFDIVFDSNNIFLALIKTKKYISNDKSNDYSFIDLLNRLSPDELKHHLLSIVENEKKECIYKPKESNLIMVSKSYNLEDKKPYCIVNCMDYLIQQCIRQVLEPICEANFSNNSYGYRPYRSVENCIAKLYKYINFSSTYFTFKVKFDNSFISEDHTKLLHQLWSIGVKDWKFLYMIKQILRTPIIYPDGRKVIPKTGLCQCGVLANLFLNIYLNEFDKWLESKWVKHPFTRRYKIRKGSENAYSAYPVMRKINMIKECYFIRYMDEICILCKTKSDARSLQLSIVNWFKNRLKTEVQVSDIIDLRKKYESFLGFKFKTRKKNHRNILISHISDKALKICKDNLTNTLKLLSRSTDNKSSWNIIKQYNILVLKYQSYFKIATHINLDFGKLTKVIYTIFKGRLKQRISKYGRPLNKFELFKYKDSRMIRYDSVTKEPIYPIGYIQTWRPFNKRNAINKYTKEGREVALHIYQNSIKNIDLFYKLLSNDIKNNSIELNNNKCELFYIQNGKCAITGKDFENLDEIHCHHIIPKVKDGRDNISNLILISEDVHILIHTKHLSTINKYLKKLLLTKEMISKINKLRSKLYLNNI